MATDSVVSSFDDVARQLREEWLHRARQEIFIKGKRDVEGKNERWSLQHRYTVVFYFCVEQRNKLKLRDRPTRMQIPSPCEDLPYKRNSSAGLGDDPQRTEIKGKLQGNSSISCGCPFPILVHDSNPLAGREQ